MFNKKILIVEDEDNIAELIEFNVKKNGYQTKRVASAEDALVALKDDDFDLILLDLMLNGMDGLDFCKIYRNLKNIKQIPIIILSARSEDSDIVSGLEFGADDYITKPFSPRVLLARIKSKLREPVEVKVNTDKIVSYEGISLNSEYYEASLDGESLTLTANEFAILRLLISSPKRVYTRDEIISYVHGAGYPITDRAIDVQIVNLRKKLLNKSHIIETVRGIGYKAS